MTCQHNQYPLTKMTRNSTNNKMHSFNNFSPTTFTQFTIPINDNNNSAPTTFTLPKRQPNYSNTEKIGAFLEPRSTIEGIKRVENSDSKTLNKQEKKNTNKKAELSVRRETERRTKGLGRLCCRSSCALCGCSYVAD